MSAIDSVFSGVSVKCYSGIRATYLDGVLLLGIPVPLTHRVVICTYRGRRCSDGPVAAGKPVPRIVRNHWLSEAARENVDSLKAELEKRPKLTFGLFLFYAFTPLPSNFLFISYGLTTMPLIRLEIPFLSAAS